MTAVRLATGNPVSVWNEGLWIGDVVRDGMAELGEPLHNGLAAFASDQSLLRFATQVLRQLG